MMEIFAERMKTFINLRLCSGDSDVSNAAEFGRGLYTIYIHFAGVFQKFYFYFLLFDILF